MAADNQSFEEQFRLLTGHDPFPWQKDLFRKFSQGRIPPLCNVPTGLGKTNVIAVWLVALARGVAVPRRLVYVVNRRTVVDQTTAEVVRLRESLPGLGIPGFATLAISTLRGQFADNREWSTDPARPAVIVGTVDMIGSRLLFSGYGVGFRSRPLHAGLLGQDALLVHDEAHLEPAFQRLLREIQRQQAEGGEFARFHVMEMTATSRHDNVDRENVLTLSQADDAHPVVRQRIHAPKHLTFTRVADDDAVTGRVAEIARGYKDDHAAVLVFVGALKAVTDVEKALKKTKRPVVLLTGTLRGKERDALVEQPAFRRFFWGSERGETVYLVCTSAGEVGIDISADHLVCDLSTFESMAQRLGRVNRYGESPHHTRVHVVYPASLDQQAGQTGEQEAGEMKIRRARTLRLLQMLPPVPAQNEEDGPVHDASPQALMTLAARDDLPCRVEEAFAPEPSIPVATDSLFDAWAMTSIRHQMPGRPAVAPYLHGLHGDSEWEPRETHIAWREEVGVIADEELLSRYPPEDLLDDYPLLPHELLRDRSDRCFKELEGLAERHGERPAWVLDPRGSVQVLTLEALVGDRQAKDIEDCTVLLPPDVGGLENGMLAHASLHADDVADEAKDEHGRPLRLRVWDQEAVPPAHLRLTRTIDTRPDADDTGEDEGLRRFWRWYELPREGTVASHRDVTWETHVADVKAHAERIVQRLSLPREVAHAVVLAAEWHDHGKRRAAFQRRLGNPRYPEVVLAKSGRGGIGLPEPFRHEFASVLDAQTSPAFEGLDEETRDLALHLIAAHHGRARPHFPADEAFDPDATDADVEALAGETPRRFARLQRKYGRWGLAYIESLLRVADWAASAHPSADVDQPEDWP